MSQTAQAQNAWSREEKDAVPRIGSVPIFVSDQDRALEFYRDRLGYEVIMDNRMGPEFRWVAVARRRGETEFVLYRPIAAMHGDEGVEQLNKRVGVWTGIVLLTDDIQESYRVLSARGVEFEAEPEEQPWGGWETWFSDPDGNRFHLAQRPRGM